MREAGRARGMCSIETFSGQPRAHVAAVSAVLTTPSSGGRVPCAIILVRKRGDVREGIEAGGAVGLKQPA